MPDLLDEPSFEEAMAGMEDAMGDGTPAGGAAGPGQEGTGQEGSGQQGTAQQAGAGQAAGTGGAAGNPGGGDAGAAGSGQYGQPGTGGGSGGPLTPAEQVAILDARLQKGTGEFDSMILAEQTAQRSAARQRPQATQSGSSGQSGSGTGGGGGAGAGEDGGMADAGEYGGGGGGYSTGGGMGGVGGGSGEIPKDAAKYPPPKDIPNGNDDDVVARQLREAAMREPDPAVREKLWDEYRKYKGISE